MTTPYDNIGQKAVKGTQATLNRAHFIFTTQVMDIKKIINFGAKKRK